MKWEGKKKEFVSGVQFGSGGNRQTKRQIERKNGRNKKKTGKDDGMGMSKVRHRCMRE